MTSPPFVLPGGRFAVDRIEAFPRLVAGAGLLLGPRAWIVTQCRNHRRAERAWAAAACRWLDLTIDVQGLGHIDPDTAYIVAPLHEGFADAVALLDGLPLDLRFVARRELAHWPLLGRALRRGGHPTLEPESGVAAYRSMLRTAPGILDTGESLVVFPQGSILGLEAAFTAGAFRLAAATKRPLLPVVISGSHRVWEHPFSQRVRFGQTIYMRVLPAIAPGDAVAMQRTVERTMKLDAVAADTAPRRFVPERDGWWDGYAYSIDPDFPELARRVADHRAEFLDRARAA